MTDATFLELLVLAHGLIVKVLTINDEEHFIHVFELGAELCGLEGRKGFT